MNQPSEIRPGAGPVLTESDTFYFHCHSQVSCFTRCCRNTDMYLYPYDIVRLKTGLGMSSEEFLKRHTTVYIRDNPHFPHVMLKMSDSEDKACPFLKADGCTVYKDRPFSCRAYPLERAVARCDGRSGRDVCYFIARHPYCRGHEEKRQWTVASWMDNQALADYNAMNDLWVDIDTIFRGNPWGNRGLDSPALKMAFMACYNVDKLRTFFFDSSFLNRITVPAARIEKIRADDAELMIFGFDWVKLFLTNAGPLRSP